MRANPYPEEMIGGFATMGGNCKNSRFVIRYDMN